MNVLATMSNLKEIDFNGSKKIQMDYETFFSDYLCSPAFTEPSMGHVHGFNIKPVVNNIQRMDNLSVMTSNTRCETRPLQFYDEFSGPMNVSQFRLNGQLQKDLHA